MKDLGDLVKDINDAACEGQERAANRIAQSLVTYSPAWTGEFSDNWVIKKGYKNKVANVKGSLNPASIPPYTVRKSLCNRLLEKLTTLNEAHSKIATKPGVKALL